MFARLPYRRGLLYSSACLALLSSALGLRAGEPPADALSLSWVIRSEEQGSPENSVAASSPPAPLHVELAQKPRVELACDYIALGDVTVCQGSADLCARLSGISLGGVAAAGQLLTITAAEIAAVLAQEEPQLAVALTGAKQTLVYALATAVDLDVLRLAYEDKVAELVAGAAEELQVQVHSVQLLHKWQVRPGPAHFEFEQELSDLVAAAEKSALTALRPLTVKVKHVPQPSCAQPQTMDLLVKMQLLQRQWVAKKALPAQSPFNPDDFELAWRPLLGRSAAALSAGGQRLELSPYTSYTLRQALPAGGLLTTALLQPPLLVARGARVTLELGSGPFALKASVQAKQPGYKDSVIEVVYEPTRKALKAVVVGKDRVVALE